MYNWFETAVKYERVADKGKTVKVTEKYLVDALTFTECEARIIKEMTPFISGEFQVATIKRAKINEMFWNENADKWFRAKVNFVSIDEKGNDKKTSVTILVQANEIKDARENLVEGMKGSQADYEIASITETSILDVYKYESDPVTEAISNIKDLMERHDIEMRVVAED